MHPNDLSFVERRPFWFDQTIHLKKIIFQMDGIDHIVQSEVVSQTFQHQRRNLEARTCPYVDELDTETRRGTFLYRLQFRPHRQV